MDRTANQKWWDEMDIEWKQIFGLYYLERKEEMTYMPTSDELEKLIRLKEVKTWYLHNVRNLKPLSEMKDLEFIDTFYCGLKDLKPLGCLEKVKKLDVHMNRIKELYPIRSFSLIEELNVSYNLLTNDSLRELKGMSKLRKISLGGNKLTSIFPIRHNKELTHLNICNLKISSINVLLYLEHLEEIQFGNKFIEYNQSENLFNQLKEFKELNKKCKLRFDGQNLDINGKDNIEDGLDSLN